MYVLHKPGKFCEDMFSCFVKTAFMTLLTLLGRLSDRNGIMLCETSEQSPSVVVEMR